LSSFGRLWDSIDVTKGWGDALATFGKGDVIQAVEAATKVKAQVEEMTRALAPPAPGGR